MNARNFDVAIVGGGPAGQLAAIYMARFRRSVALVDAGHSRLATIPKTRNFPGFPDGVAGSTLLRMLKDQAARYPIEQLAGEVTDMARGADAFSLRWDGGELNARLVLLATGTSDVVPEMDHVAEAVASGLVRYCPVCDAYEVSERHVGVITNDARGVAEALYLRHFTPHVTLFRVGGGRKLASADKDKLNRAGVHVAPGRVRRISARGAQVAVAHAQGETLCDSVYGALGLVVHSSLARRLAARTDRHGYLVTDRRQQTSVDGLFAAGDVVQGLNQIAVGCGAAAIASAAMHRRLLEA